MVMVLLLRDSKVQNGMTVSLMTMEKSMSERIIREVFKAVFPMVSLFISGSLKSVATLLMEQETVDMEGNDTILKARGRHDPCVLPRAVPIVEAMAAMTLLDYWLMQQARVMER